jgi:hypothetical protein
LYSNCTGYWWFTRYSGKLNPALNKGTGFTFKAEDEILFYAAIIRALEIINIKRLGRAGKTSNE